MNKTHIMLGVSLGMLLLIGVLIFFMKPTNAGETIEAELIDGTTTKVLEDKVVNYTNSTQELKVSSADGLKEELVTIKLDTPLNYQVGLGYQKVAQITVSPKIDINSFIKQLELYNLKENSKSITKPVDYKYLSIGTKEVIDYTTECTATEEISKNGTKVQDCKQVISGSHFEDEWLSYDGKLLTDKPITLALFADVKEGEKIEWIPTFTVDTTDVKVTEWATWTGNLSTGLTTAYHLDEASGTVVVDSANRINMTNYGITVNQAGLLNQAYLYDTNSDAANATGFGTNGSAFTSYNLWANITSAEQFDRVINIRNTAGGDKDTSILFTSTTAIQATNYDGTSYNTADITYTPYFNKWTMITLTNNGTLNLYLDGVLKTSNTRAITYDNSKLTLGNEPATTRAVNGKIDEAVFWNRTLSQTDITYLYNSGVGCAYGTECYSQPCNFSGYVKDGSGNGLNGADIVIFNQNNKSETYNTTSGVTGLWLVEIMNSTKNFTAVAYLNNSLIGQAKPFISGRC
jgi:hypothetical protein